LNKLTFSVFLTLLSSQLVAAPLSLATGEFAPYTGEKLPDQGESTKIVKSVFKEMNQDITIEFMPWNRGMNKLKNNSVAGSFPWVMSNERKEFLYFSEPIHKYKIVHFVKRDFNLEFNEKLNHKILCHPEGWESSMYQDMIAKYKLTQVRPITIESCFRMLEKNRVDFISVNENIGQETIKRLYPNVSPFKMVISPIFLNELRYHFVVPKKYPNAQKIMKDFNAALLKIKKNL